jgi:hypothetical protein
MDLNSFRSFLFLILSLFSSEFSQAVEEVSSAKPDSRFEYLHADLYMQFSSGQLKSRRHFYFCRLSTTCSSFSFFVFNSSHTPSTNPHCMRLFFSLASGSAPTEDSYLSLFCDFRISMVWFCGFFAASGMRSA